MLPRFSCRGLVAVLINYNEDGADRRLVVCSAYLPSDSKDPPPLKELEELVRYCQTENLHLVIRCELKAHHTVWGGTNCNDRGVTLVEFLKSMNLEILNQGNVPTFCSGRRMEVIDITLGSFGLLGSVKSWEVSSGPPCRTRHILFTLQGSIPVHLYRNPRFTSWDSFPEGLRDRLQTSPEMNMKDEARLGLQSPGFSRS